LVAIDGARVRAAIEWKGMSVNGAAGRIDVIAAHGCSVLGGAREPGPIGAGSGVE